MATISPGYIGRYTGKLSPVWSFTLLDDSGVAMNLSTATISGYTQVGTNVSKMLGTFTVVNASIGLCSYQWTSGDLSAPGAWHVYISAKLSAEPSAREFDPALLAVLPTPEFIGGLIVQEVNINVNDTPNTSINPVFVQLVASIVSHVVVDSLPAISLAASNAAIGHVTVDALPSLVLAAGSASIGSVVPLVGGSATSTSNPVPTTSGQVGVVAPYVSNPSATGVTTDAAFKWGASGTTTIQRFMISNETGADVRYDTDAAATANSIRIKDGVTVFVAQPTAALHFYTAANQSFNVAGGVIVRGWN